MYEHALKSSKQAAPSISKILRMSPVANMYYAEREEHHRYKDYRMRGEWFLFPIEMLSSDAAYTHKHLRLSELKREIAFLRERIQSLEDENASLKQQVQ